MNDSINLPFFLFHIDPEGGAQLNLFKDKTRLAPVSNVILFCSKTDNLSKIAIYKFNLE